MSTYRIVIAIISLGLLLSAVEAGLARSLGLAAKAYRVPRSIAAPYTNRKMSTAIGFGKRGSVGLYSVEMDAGYNGISKYVEDQRAAIQTNLNQSGDVIPLDWMINEFSQNPQLARSILQKFVDKNNDGYVSTAELLRTPNDCADNV